jgi:hypothetical protein
MPLTFLKDLEVRSPETIDVIMEPGAEQVVLAPYQRSQVQLTFINAAMSFVGFLVFGTLVFFWNRHLSEQEAGKATVVD